MFLTHSPVLKFKEIIRNYLQLLYHLLVGAMLIIAVLLTLVIILSVAFDSITNRPILVLMIGLAAAIFVYVWSNREKIYGHKNSLRFLLFEIFKLGFAILFFCAIALSVKKAPKPSKPRIVDESVTLYTDSIDGEVEKYYLSTQSWRDFSRKPHTLPFKINFDNVELSTRNRKNYKVSFGFKWGDFYQQLSGNDQVLINELAETFYSYQQQEKLSRVEFAELMISAIQDIPYNLILSRACDSLDIKPCYGNIKLGLYAPAEFISHLRGDCDTRTVLLFTLLSRFNYDIAILNSQAYKHSILGIHIPATGKFKSINNKRYYFVETTTRGCPIGYLHPEWSDIKKWDFELLFNTKS